MKKLLHERLRDYANLHDVITINSESYTNPFTYHIAKLLADEIERYYIPRPRFEDGEPVHTGDETDRGTAWVIAVFGDGDWHVHTIDGTILESEDYDSGLKRPSPKALDADGVPIKIGDTVYTITNYIKLSVLSFDTNCDGETVVQTDCGRYKPARLTHKPDSLERLLEDMYAHADAADCEITREWHERLYSIMERD